MNFIKQRGSTEIDKPAETEIEGNIRELVRRDSTGLRQTGSDSEVAANNLSNLLRRVSANSTREIENLIGELRVLRDKLQNDGSRVERDIVEYAALSQSVAQLTKIIADGVIQVKKVPDAPSISE
jgi:chemotaxis protein histidine kinase CheA